MQQALTEALGTVPIVVDDGTTHAEVLRLADDQGIAVQIVPVQDILAVDETRRVIMPQIETLVRVIGSPAKTTIAEVLRTVSRVIQAIKQISSPGMPAPNFVRAAYQSDQTGQIEYLVVFNWQALLDE